MGIGRQCHWWKIYGDWQGLEEKNLYEGRDVPITTDLRSVLAHIAERHLKLSDQQLSIIFPNMMNKRNHLKFIA